MGKNETSEKEGHVLGRMTRIVTARDRMSVQCLVFRHRGDGSAMRSTEGWTGRRSSFHALLCFFFLVCCSSRSHVADSPSSIRCIPDLGRRLRFHDKMGRRGRQANSGICQVRGRGSQPAASTSRRKPGPQDQDLHVASRPNQRSFQSMPAASMTNVHERHAQGDLILQVLP